ncbi:MAG TPA: class I SAM-dependent methyltransferase [Candidatus Binataceae bacterium]|nr:class I SAM-dependent methyltransferase [Candidatus Binataceae bacterium]
MALYDKIGVGYDTTRQADPYLLSRILHHLGPKPGARYLDVGSGTGNYTIAMRRAGLAIYAIELSPIMLASAVEKSREVFWHRADAQAIPFRSETFAGATMTFVHHHIRDPIAAFRDIRRVLKPGSRFVVLNGTAEQLHHYWLIEYFPRTMEQAAEPLARYELGGALGAAGLKIVTTEKYEVTDDLKDWFLYCGKKRPELYLDPRVRAGISCFAASYDQDEINRGVERLAADIQSGRIKDVIRRYIWDGGDYLFTIAER